MHNCIWVQCVLYYYLYLNSGGNLVLLNIWGADHGPWMQALHAIFGAGAWMGPLIAKPFLAEQPQDTDILDVVPASEEVIMQSTSGLMQLVGDHCAVKCVANDMLNLIDR